MGTAWVGLTPFVMADVRPPGVPAAVPGVPTFAGTNLRTYVRYRDRRDALWFLSIEVACPLMLAARAVGAPYNPGTLSISTSGDTVSYAGKRWAGGPSYRVVVRPGNPTERPRHRAGTDGSRRRLKPADNLSEFAGASG